MNQIIIKSFEHLNDVVFVGCYDDSLNRYRNNYVYRGLSDADYPLITSLNRVCSHDLSLENSIIRNFKKYGYADLNQKDSFWQTLATGQHFGLPTRLLDWTYSPLVAAHFVTVNTDDYDKDGVIYAIDTSESLPTLPSVLREKLESTRASSFSISMLDSVAKDFDELKALKREPFFLFYEPASGDDRMINQYSLFSMCSDPSYTVDQLVDDNSTLCKLVIPKEIKLEIRDKLDYINISERVISPGLDSICSWISRRYANLGGKK